jgi:hypothetical protein
MQILILQLLGGLRGRRAEGENVREGVEIPLSRHAWAGTE